MIRKGVAGDAVVHAFGWIGVFIQRAPWAAYQPSGTVCATTTHRFHIHHLSPCLELMNLSTSLRRLRYSAETPTAGYPMLRAVSLCRMSIGAVKGLDI